MDIMVYEKNIEKDCLTVMVIDWKNFDQKIKERPEDYVFILSPDEMNEFIELDKQIRAGLASIYLQTKEAEYFNQYPGILVIVKLGIQPDFVQRYKIGYFTHKILGLSHAVFYINRATDDIERSNAVLRRIMDYKANTKREDNKRN